jgi:hypothetical protein
MGASYSWLAGLQGCRFRSGKSRVLALLGLGQEVLGVLHTNVTIIRSEVQSYYSVRLRAAPFQFNRFRLLPYHFTVRYEYSTVL